MEDYVVITCQEKPAFRPVCKYAAGLQKDHTIPLPSPPLPPPSSPDETTGVGVAEAPGTGVGVAAAEGAGVGVGLSAGVGVVLLLLPPVLVVFELLTLDFALTLPEVSIVHRPVVFAIRARTYVCCKTALS